MRSPLPCRRRCLAPPRSPCAGEGILGGNCSVTTNGRPRRWCRSRRSRPSFVTKAMVATGRADGHWKPQLFERHAASHGSIDECECIEAILRFRAYARVVVADPLSADRNHEVGDPLPGGNPGVEDVRFKAGAFRRVARVRRRVAGRRPGDRWRLPVTWYQVLLLLNGLPTAAAMSGSMSS